MEHFAALRDSLRHERIGHGGLEVSHALSHALDAALAELHAEWDSSTALVALGGYGRRELSPHSDVDLMLLHESEEASSAAAAVFRPLWDAKLKVGHSVRTVDEAAAAARERFDTQTTLLTARLVSGPEDLYSELAASVAAVTRARPLRSHLVEAEKERRAASPYLVMATDLKDGRGGLRVLQGFEWERRREDLIGRFSADESEEESQARETLLQVRNALHIAAGRRHDVFSNDLRQQVARWLGVELGEIGRSLVHALRSVDDLASSRWPELTGPESPRGPRRFLRRQRRPSPGPIDRPPAVELAALLEGGPGDRIEAEKPDGLLASLLPEYRAVIDLPQLEPFHTHPVADHLWRTVAEMRMLRSGGGQFGAVSAALSRPRLLTFAAFLHDIGKGTGRDHSVAGAEIAADFARRCELDPQETALLVDAVRHHLLLASTATRRDLDDPAVIADVAQIVGSLQQLQVLYLLTVADSKATGPSMWSEWKATLLRSLYLRVAALLDGDRDAATVPTASREEVIELARGTGVRGIEDHLEAMPDSYLRSAEADEIVWHARLIGENEDSAHLGVRDSDPHQKVAVVGPITREFRHFVASAFAANGVDVLEARLFTRSDGMAVDVFHVRDDMTGDVVPEERWDRVRSDIADGLNGDIDPLAKTAARASAYGYGQSGAASSVAAVVDDATGGLSVVVKAPDRIGRLAEVLAVMADCGLEIRLAKLDVREGGIVDTFHIAPPSRDDLRAMERRIAAGLTD